MARSALARPADQPSGAARSSETGTGAAESWRDDLRVVLPSWLAARVLVTVGYVLAAGVARRYFAGNEPLALGQGLLAWDGTYYRDIATVGYANLPEPALRFFPLYPLLGRGLEVILLGRVDVALVLLANGCSLAAAVVMRRLVLFEKGDEQLAERAVWLTALFPSAFVLVWAYAEGLFLLLAVGTFLAARRGRWEIAAMLGLLAALTRPVGILLAVPMLIEALRDRSRQPTAVWLGKALAVVMPAAGCAVYLGWVGRHFGDARLPFTVQDTLRASANPIVRLVEGVGDLFGPERFGDGLHLPFAVAFVALVVVVWRRWPASYGAFATVLLLAALSADNLNSLERYGLNAFPLVLGLATVATSQRLERLALAVCGGGLMALTALAWLGIYVP